MTEEQKKSNSGRHKGTDNKEREYIYFRKSVIEAHGGWDKLLEKIYNHIEKITKKK